MKLSCFVSSLIITITIRTFLFDRRENNSRQRFLLCNQTKVLIHIACQSRSESRRCFPATSSYVRHRGFVLTTYITRPRKRTGLHERRPQARRRHSSRFVTRITASYPSNPSKQLQKQHMARQLWSSVRFITSDTRCISPHKQSHGQKNKKRVCLIVRAPRLCV